MALALESGFINGVYASLGKDGATVTKHFIHDELAGTPASQRLRREHVALQRHSRLGMAPRPLEVDEKINHIVMEYIPSSFHLDDHIHTVTGEERETILHQAGSLLQEVHVSVNHNTEAYLTQYAHKTFRALQKTGTLLLEEDIDILRVFDTINTTLRSEEAREKGVTHVHRDPWLNNFLYSGDDQKIVGLIDWEFAGIGSPYEDFAVVDLWITREHGNTDVLWEGYGNIPDRKTLLGFVMAKAIQLLANTNPEAYRQEKQQGGGFYTNKITVMKDILAELQKEGEK